MRLATALVLAGTVFVASAIARADDPPAGTEKKAAPKPPASGYSFDLKTNKTPYVADDVGGRPPVKPEPKVPFLGLSITRPIGDGK